jgi:hypothetical protein
LFSRSDTYILFNANNKIEINLRNAATNYFLITTPVYRDPSAWYHIVVTLDTNNGVAADRLKLYVNNVRVEQYDNSTYQSIGAGYEPLINSAAIHYIGGPDYFNGYMAEINFVDGQALTPSSFGETDPQTGVWIPKVYTGSYGTNGFRLRFNNNSSTTALGYDTSGNGNNWTPNNFSVTAGSGNDSMLDVPSLYGTDTGLGGEVRGNYATWNPLVASQTGSTLSNGNLDVVTPTTGTGKTNYGEVTATIGVSSGKWYWEVLTVAIGGGKSHVIGVDSDANASGADGLISAGNRYSYASFNGNKYSGATSSAYGATYDVGDTVGVALDMDNGSITFYKNGVSQGVAFTGLSGAYYPAISDTGGGNVTLTANFGQRPFAYTAPSGFKALCTTNLSAPIGQTSTNQADNFFQATVYTGNGNTSPGQLVSLDFQPDFVWIKERTSTEWHQLYDALRTTNALFSNNADAQVSLDGVTLTSSGFYAKDAFRTNENTAPYVAWSWNAGGSTVTNTQGTITSSVRANPASGFSVVGYAGNSTAGATVGHGLGVAPAMVIYRLINATSAWVVYHQSIPTPAVNGMRLNTTDAAASTGGAFNSTAPNSTVLTLGGASLGTNDSGYNFVAYCFAAIPGFSAFGSYTGNASTDGPFVYLGFRPRFVMIKSTSAGTEWVMMDTSRSPYNLAEAALYANRDYSESTIGAVNDLDLLSNGFKLRNTTGFVNASQTYIYAAFAEYPFRLALAR